MDKKHCGIRSPTTGRTRGSVKDCAKKKQISTRTYFRSTGTHSIVYNWKRNMASVINMIFVFMLSLL